MSNLHAALRKTSLVDYPGKISAVLFFPGCNLACPWCHNPELVRGGLEGGVSLDEVFSFLEKRRKVLEAVVLSGGEVTLCKDLPEIISSIKRFNLLVKLDTNGTRPEMLESLFANRETKPDYIALDLKIPPHRYSELAKNQNLPQEAHHDENNFGESLKKSAALIAQYKVPHEFRTLILPDNYLREDDIDAMAEVVDDAPWVFRSFVPGSCLDESWNAFPKTSLDENNPLIRRAKTLGKRVVVYR